MGRHALDAKDRNRDRLHVIAREIGDPPTHTKKSRRGEPRREWMEMGQEGRGTIPDAFDIANRYFENMTVRAAEQESVWASSG